MQRRDLLAGLAATGAAATAGCGFRATGPIRRQSFTVCDSESECAENGPKPGGDPVVERTEDGSRITVYGAMYVGSSSCDRAVLESARVTGDTLRVHVGIGPKGWLPNLGCTGDMSVDWYRARFWFRGDLPASVEVVEDAAYDPIPPSETPTETATGSTSETPE